MHRNQQANILDKNIHIYKQSSLEDQLFKIKFP